jgi:hypothetical protein
VTPVPAAARMRAAQRGCTGCLSALSSPSAAAPATQSPPWPSLHATDGVPLSKGGARRHDTLRVWSQPDNHGRVPVSPLHLPRVCLSIACHCLPLPLPAVAIACRCTVVVDAPGAVLWHPRPWRERGSVDIHGPHRIRPGLEACDSTKLQVRHAPLPCQARRLAVAHAVIAFACACASQPQLSSLPTAHSLSRTATTRRPIKAPLTTLCDTP